MAVMKRTMALFLFIAAGLPAQKRPITHEDVWLMKRVSGLAVSPDGKWAVVSVNEPSYDETKAVSDLWIVPSDGSSPARRLTSTKGGESNAVFAPDSTRIAFSAKRESDEVNQIYVLPLAGGEAARVTSISTGASNPQWRPDGKVILFQSLVYPNAATDQENKKIAAERKARKYNARVYEDFPFRYWDRWLDDLRPHIFVQALAEGAQPRDLLAGTKLAASPGFDGRRSVGDAELEAVWSPDGGTIVFSATADRNVAAYAPTTTHLYRLAASGGEPAPITQGADSYSGPRFRPDGKALYALHTRRGDKQLYSLSRLARMDWPAATGQPKLIAGGWDRSVSAFAFSPDSLRLYLTAEEHGLDRLFAMPADGGLVQPVLEAREGCHSALAIPARAPAPLLVATWGSMVHPDDVVVVDPKTRSQRFLTAFNQERIEQIDWQPPLHFWFTAQSGKRIHSLIVLPPAFDKSRKYPLLVFPHGGPHSMSKDQYFVRWNYHLLTSPGYVLIMTNFTGSTGFGEEFAGAIHQDILRGPGSEIEQAADAAIKEYPFIDGSRQAAAGASYGGYFMNWFEGNSTRFKCLVNHAGLTDNASMWGATDGAWYWERRNGGPVWELKGVWREQSPSAYAANYRTPMLITHGERDFRVPINQAFEIYKLLQRRRVPCRMVIFPDASHWVLKGEDARYHMQEVLAWLKKYL
jgi:dipeptidyl aminopeptidase/acylaminoacyl peptidase